MHEDLQTTFAEAQASIGDGPVVMVNLLSFRDAPVYPADFKDRKVTGRAAYYEGYAGAFREIAAALGVTAELIYAGRHLATLLPAGRKLWDDLVVVRYQSFADLRSIVATQDYCMRAEPHRIAALSDWQFIATKP